jgi:hypothetical protein
VFLVLIFYFTFIRWDFGVGDPHSILKGVHVTFTWIVHVDGRIYLGYLTGIGFDPSLLDILQISDSPDG